MYCLKCDESYFVTFLGYKSCHIMLCMSITLCLLNCILTLFRLPMAGNTFLEDRKVVSPTHKLRYFRLWSDSCRFLMPCLFWLLSLIVNFNVVPLLPKVTQSVLEVIIVVQSPLKLMCLPCCHGPLQERKHYQLRVPSSGKIFISSFIEISPKFLTQNKQTDRHYLHLLYSLYAHHENAC